MTLPDIFYDYTECDEVAEGILADFARKGGKPFASFDEVLRFVRTVMPDQV
jgi:hypothetical protein